MSSLRLALKQSLQESGLSQPSKARKKSKKNKKRNKSKPLEGSGGQKSGLPSTTATLVETTMSPSLPLTVTKPAVGNTGNSSSLPNRQPGDPPRKRGRPRKHPRPDDDDETRERLLTQLRLEREQLQRRHQQSSSSSSSSENEFSEEEDDDDDDETSTDEEEETGPKDDSMKPTKPDGDNIARNGSNSDATIEKNKLLEFEKSKETKDELRDSNADEHSKSNPSKKKIFKKMKQTVVSATAAPTSSQPQSNPSTSERPAATTSSNETSGGSAKPNKKERQQTVPPPSNEIVEWISSMSAKKQRSHISAGLRVKVRFVTKIKKRDGKILRKLKWYGGLVTAVSKGGSKIRIKYDDGTSEVSKFPDVDIVVDSADNGRHRVNAEAFLPESDDEDEEDDEEEEELTGIADEAEKSAAAKATVQSEDEDDERKGHSKRRTRDVEMTETSNDGMSADEAPRATTPHEMPMVEVTGTKNIPVAETSTVRKGADAEEEEDDDDDDNDDDKNRHNKRGREQNEAEKPAVGGKFRGDIEESSDDDNGGPLEIVARPSEIVVKANRGMQKDTQDNMISELPSAVGDSGPKPLEKYAPELPSKMQQKSKLESEVEISKGETGDLNGSKEGSAKESERFLEEKQADAPAFGQAAESKEAKHTIRQSKDGSSQKEETARKGPKIHIKLKKNKRSIEETMTEKETEGSWKDDGELARGWIGKDRQKSGTVRVEPPAKQEQDLMKPLSRSSDDQVESGERDQPPAKKSKLEVDNGMLAVENDADAEEQARLEKERRKGGKMTEKERRRKEKDPQEVKEKKRKDPRQSPTVRKAKSSDSLDDSTSLKFRKKKRDESGGRRTPVKSSRNTGSSALIDGDFKKNSSSDRTINSRTTVAMSSGKLKDEEEEAEDGEVVEDTKPESQIATSKNTAFDRREQRERSHSGTPSPPAEADEQDGAPIHDRNDSSGNLQRSSGRRAAQQAHERIVSRQELVIESFENPKRKKDKDGREKVGREKKRKENDDGRGNAEEDEIKWVQCNSCGKWRVLPTSFDVDKLPKEWFCEMNTSDPNHNSCDDPEQTLEEVKKIQRKAKRRKARLARIEAEREAAAAAAAAAAPPVSEEGQKTLSSARESQKKEKIDKRRTRSPVPERRGSSNDDQQNSDSGSSDPKPEKKRKRPSTTEETDDFDESPHPGKVGKKRGRKPARELKEDKGKKSKDKEADNQEWVQCEKCEKWRRLPSHISADDLPDVWFCSMNHWDSNRASCNAEEDKAEPGIREFTVTGFPTTAGHNKLSYRNLIFGTGKRRDRTVSERMRAAESLFSLGSFDENHHPTLKYANSFLFVPKSQKSDTDREGGKMSFLELMNKSALWSELREIGKEIVPQSVPNVTGASATFGYSVGPELVYDGLPTTLKDEMKDLVLYALGTATMAGHEVLLEIQCRPMSNISKVWAELRGLCTANSVAAALIELVDEGKIEAAPSDQGPPLGASPKYRRVVKATKVPSLSEKSTPKRPVMSTRCMKIAKPWKRGSLCK